MRDKRINIDDISYFIPNMEIKSDTDYLEDVINNAIDNNTMSLEDIAKLENVLTLMELML